MTALLQRSPASCMAEALQAGLHSLLDGHCIFPCTETSTLCPPVPVQRLPCSYLDGHIPGAVFWDWTSVGIDEDDEAPIQLQTNAGLFAAEMEAMGIGTDRPAVVRPAVSHSVAHCTGLAELQGPAEAHSGCRCTSPVPVAGVPSPMAQSCRLTRPAKQAHADNMAV